MSPPDAVMQPQTGPPRDLFTADFTNDPHPVLAALREQAAAHPVALPNGLRVWLVTRYDEARALLADPRLRNEVSREDYARNYLDPVRRGRYLAGRHQLGSELNDHLLHADPPRHTRLRRLVGKAFTTRRVEGLRPRIVELVDSLLDRAAPCRQVDLLDVLAFPVPFAVICWLLGIEVDDRASFRRWSNLLVSGVGSDEGDQAAVAMVDYLRGLVSHKRTDPGDDLLSALVQTTNDGDALTETELISMASILLIAGYETTVNLIGNGTLALLTHPEQRARLAADPDLWPAAVDELLRFEPPLANAISRVTTAPVHLDGITIGEGELVVVSLIAAARDPARYPDPDHLDVTRSTTGDLAFSHGVHRCLGAPLARLEGQVVLRRLFERFPRLRLAVEPSDLRWRFSLPMRGLEALPVLLTDHGRPLEG